MQLTIRPASVLAAGLALMISGALIAQETKPPREGPLAFSSSPEALGPTVINGGACAGGEIYDDGTAENGYGGSAGTVTSFEGVMQFTPASYPNSYQTVCIGMVSLGGPTLDLEIEVRDDDGAGGTPGTLLGTVPLSLTDLPSGLPCTFYTVDISGLGLNITGGSVFIGARWDPTAFPSRFLCADETPATPLQPGFVNFNNPSAWETTESVFPAYRAQLIRAVPGAGTPTLSIGNVTDMDMCAAIPANNNGIIEPGEAVNFTIPVQASGGDFTNVVGTLTSATAGVTVVTGMGTYGNITDGNSASANYSITVAETVACDSIIDLNLAVTSTEDNFAFPISRNVGQSATFTYNNLPLAIPDNAPAGASSTANVSGVPGAITNVQVQINTTHTWVGDLIYTLTSPGGTTVTLLDRPNVPLGTFGCSNNDVNVLFADGQPDPESVCSGAPPQGNTADPWPVTDASPVPGDAMADFNGEDANGTWTLTISDNGGGDTGTLVDWELIITPVATGTCEVCPANADVSIVKTAAAPNPLTVGDTITYTLAASNAGPGPASNVVVTDPLPANVTYVSNTCGAAFAAQTVTWTIGNLASGANASCDIVVTVNAVGPINNTATISADQTDPTPANNASTAALAGAFLADVSIMKSNTANAGLAPGDAFSFILTVTNNGPTGASNIVVTDVLSDKVSYVSNNCAAVFAGNTLTWTIPALANGAEATCQIDVIFVGLGDVTNTATATAVEPDPDLSNNTATDVATVAAQPIPALNGFTLAALAALMAGLGLWMRRRYVKS